MVVATAEPPTTRRAQEAAARSARAPPAAMLPLRAVCPRSRSGGAAWAAADVAAALRLQVYPQTFVEAPAAASTPRRAWEALVGALCVEAAAEAPAAVRAALALQQAALEARAARARLEQLQAVVAQRAPEAPTSTAVMGLQ